MKYVIMDAGPANERADFDPDIAMLADLGRGAALGGAIGTAVPLIGNAVGSVIGGVLGGGLNLLRGAFEKEPRIIESVRKAVTAGLEGAGLPYKIFLGAPQLEGTYDEAAVAGLVEDLKAGLMRQAAGLDSRSRDKMLRALGTLRISDRQLYTHVRIFAFNTRYAYAGRNGSVLPAPQPAEQLRGSPVAIGLAIAAAAWFLRSG